MSVRFLLVSLAASVLIAGCGDGGSESSSWPEVSVPPPLGDERRRGCAASEAAFGSVADLTETADVVLIGTVRSIAEGDLSGNPDEDPLRTLDVSLAVEETLKGTGLRDETAVVPSTACLYSDSDSEFTDWRRPGTRIVGFFREFSGPDGSVKYVQLNVSQSLYVIDGDDLATIAESNELNSAIAALTLDELRRRIASTPSGATDLHEGTSRADDAAANEAIISALPTYPGAEVVETTMNPYFAEETALEPEGHTTNVVYRVPEGTEGVALNRFYEVRLEPEWRCHTVRLGGVKLPSGPPGSPESQEPGQPLPDMLFLNCRKNTATVSVNPDNLESTPPRFELSVDHDGRGT